MKDVVLVDVDVDMIEHSCHLEEIQVSWHLHFGTPKQNK